MKFHRYWAKATKTVSRPYGSFEMVAYGGSDLDLRDAERVANQRVEAAAHAANRGAPRDYGYTDDVLREEVVQTVDPAGGSPFVMTRNGYGALVLNATDTLFADIDDPPRASGGCLGALFGRGTVAPEPAMVALVEELVRTHPGLGVRLYRTRGGFRAVVTSGGIRPDSDLARAILTQLSSDPLYVALCDRQRCFRARLSPKPWRCGLSRPPTRFPFIDPGAEERFREWQQRYHEIADRYATCERVGDFGVAGIAPDVAPVVAFHDQIACVAGAPLA